VRRTQTGHNPARWEHRAPRGEWDLVRRAVDHGETARALDLLLPGKLDHQVVTLVTANAGAMAISHAIRDAKGAWES
jgi:hypothetical protein